MVPKDFKDRIITPEMDQEVDLDYKRWLVHGLDIDMFEMLTILTLYSRGSLHERLKLIYNLYCLQDDNNMSKQEFEFLITKVATSVSTTLSVKKSLLNELTDLAKPKLFPDKDNIIEDEFITIMLSCFKDFNNRLSRFGERISVFNATVRK